MYRRPCAAIVMTMALCTRAAPAHPLDDVRSAKVDAIVHYVMRDRHVRGIELGISRDGAPIYLRGYGWGGRNPARAVTARTVMPIGSLTKSFTAAATRIAMANGTLHEGTPMAPFFPRYAAAASVTLADLLQMRSGIPDYSERPGFVRTARSPVAPDALLATIETLPLNFTPGSQTEYSNTNYLMLALIVQQTARMPFAEFSQRELLDPLTLRATSLAQGYSLGFGSADLESTADDMLKWLSALDAGTIVRLPCTRAPYDNGFFAGTFFDRPACFAAGYVAGYSSFAARLPSERLDIVLLSDADSVDLGPLARSIVAIVLGAREAAP